jgi:DNA-binding MarR family transcriptional regulator
MGIRTVNMKANLGLILSRTHRILAARLAQRFSEKGHVFSLDQWIVMMRLWVDDGQTQQSLATQSFKDKTSITRLIDTLERKDLVIRVPDKVDRRSKLIYLTNKGKQLQQELLPHAQDILNEAIEGIETQDLAIAEKVLNQIYQNFNGEEEE